MAREAATRASISITEGSKGWRRAKDRSWRVSATPRWAAVSMALAAKVAFSLPSATLRSVPRKPVTIISRLLKSCATPPVSWPSASIFWA